MQLLNILTAINRIKHIITTICGEPVHYGCSMSTHPWSTRLWKQCGLTLAISHAVVSKTSQWLPVTGTHPTTVPLQLLVTFLHSLQKCGT